MQFIAPVSLQSVIHYAFAKTLRLIKCTRSLTSSAKRTMSSSCGVYTQRCFWVQKYPSRRIAVSVSVPTISLINECDNLSATPHLFTNNR